MRIVRYGTLASLAALLLIHPGTAHARKIQHHPAHPLHAHPSATHHTATHPSITHHSTAHHRTTHKAQPHARKARVAPRTPIPSRVSDRPLIVIDPGHGGRDPGAIGASGVQEKTIALEAGLELRRLLNATGRYRVAMTRTTDETVSLGDRLAFAQRRDADLLIAIHADASRDPRARGASVYVRSGNKTTHLAAGRAQSHQIANALQAPRPEPGSAWLQYSMIEQLADDVRMVVAPARAAHLYVLASNSIPGVLVETGFLSNRKDEALLKQPAHRHVLVQAIKDAIDDYFAAIRSHRSHT